MRWELRSHFDSFAQEEYLKVKLRKNCYILWKLWLTSSTCYYSCKYEAPYCIYQCSHVDYFSISSITMILTFKAFLRTVTWFSHTLDFLFLDLYKYLEKKKNLNMKLSMLEYFFFCWCQIYSMILVCKSLCKLQCNRQWQLHNSSIYWRTTYTQ